MIWVWAGIFILTLVIEIVTVELASIWFTFGSLVAFILALCDVSINIQIIVFLVVSTVLLACLRTIFIRLLKKNNEKTNLDTVIGTTHTLLKGIGLETLGEIKLNGVVWGVTTENGEQIEAGEKVQIVEVRGNKFIVKKEIKND